MAAADDAVVAGVGVVADVVEAAEFVGQLPGLRFGEVHQGGVDLEGVVHCEVEGGIHGFDEYVAAVGVAGEVGFAYAGDDVADVLSFGADGGVKQEQGVAAVDEGVGEAVFGGLNGGGVVGEGVLGDVFDEGEVEDGLFDAPVLGDAAGAFEFDGVALAVLEADCLDVFAAVGLDGLDEAGGGVLSAGEDDEGFFAVHGVFLAMG